MSESLEPYQHSEVPTSPNTAKTQIQIVPEQWDLAWVEFGRRHPRLKHGAIVTNWIVFNGLGLSVLAGTSLVYGWLPLWAWVVVSLSTLLLSQMFVSTYSGLAYRKRIHELETPNLEIVFDESDGSFVYPFKAGDGQDYIMFKVAITSTIPDLVSLQIPNMVLGDGKATNLYLHITDDTTYIKRETRLNAHDDPVYWDVIASRPRYGKFFSTADQFLLQHIKPNTTKEIHASKTVEFPITASGREGNMPTRKVVRFSLDENGKPCFQLREP